MTTEGSIKSDQDAADLLDIFPPILVKELRQGMRANQFVWPFIALQIAAIVTVVLEYVVQHAYLGGLMGSQLFYSLIWGLFAAVLPLTLFGSLQPELAVGRNVELLLMSNLSRWQIVLGKWVVGCMLSGLMLVSLLPYWLVRYLIGGVTEVGKECLIILGVFAVNAIMNSVVIGASGFRNYVGRVFLIGLNGMCGFLTIMACCGGLFRLGGMRPSGVTLGLAIVGGGVAGGLVVLINLQMGRAKLRLFENPLDPPSTALISVLVICAPIIMGITAGMLGSWGTMAMAGALLWLVLAIDPGPGKKNRRWAQP